LRQALEVGLRDDVASGDSLAGNDQQDCIDGYCRLAASIGRRVGELHAVLASPTEDEAFSPHMTTSDDVRRWTNGVVELMSAAFDTLAERTDMLNDDARAAARSLLARRAAVLDHALTLVSGDAQALCLRIHGDLHLGQVLIAEGDAYLIDFEGEPARPVEERRRKASPLRDVAGMLRSFCYASATVAAETGDAGARGVTYTADLVQQFRVRAQAAFLTAYRDALAAADLSVTHDEETFAALLELFLLEKGAYEIRYEAANRPGWIGVPLRGLSDLVDQSLGTS
jgi:maltose alpha-D-glucosyltransferase/alpha-amylase